ncbi:cytochrome c-type biogenesis protein [Aureimonas sp. ME7]|uniref:cytochrome c-type biogenesis protein n=1 Tax=Aureimonas sp. ME7 TaxID=2744252 RepID=UPI0015F741DF|nr:cytochrome c-type biogenesis protein [Aureimonas sp. ME7]
MTRARLRLALAFAALTAISPAWAVRPDEMLADPKLEQRARDLSAGLRCMVCQNQSIDDSDAPLARDLRILVRERLQAGDDDGEVLDYLVSRYGQFVLLRPRLEWETAVLWGTPLVLLAIGGVLLVRRNRIPTASTAHLSPEEETRLRALLDETGDARR